MRFHVTPCREGLEFIEVACKHFKDVFILWYSSDIRGLGSKTVSVPPNVLGNFIVEILLLSKLLIIYYKYFIDR